MALNLRMFMDSETGQLKVESVPANDGEEQEKMANKFAVGDKIRALKSSNGKYGATCEKRGYEGIVVSLKPSGRIATRTTKIDGKTDEDETINTVEAEYFGLQKGGKADPGTRTDYKPGMNIKDYIKKLIPGVSNKERKKQLETFNRCVLPDDVREAIEQAITTALLPDKFEEWGFNEHFEKGLTNSILLYGPPGTGKTMVSEAIASVLGKNLMRLSSGDIQSNIPGQTERNIRDSFAKAQKEKCVLLLDECDSVLSNRDNVGTILGAEINCLLTEIERFDGEVLLTTNRLHRLDPALQRRIISKVELQVPNRKAREQIWKNLIPEKCPTKGVNHKELSEPTLTGGEIKNAILIAARTAIAKNHNHVSREQFMVAINGVLKSKDDYDNTRPMRLHASVNDYTTEKGKGKGRDKVGE